MEALYVAGLCRCYNCNLDGGTVYFENALKLNQSHEKSQIMLQVSIYLKQTKEKADRLFNECRYREACET